jgi:hypothetical protein
LHRTPGGGYLTLGDGLAFHEKVFEVESVSFESQNAIPRGQVRQALRDENAAPEPIRIIP